jgi:hypothetical protein
VRGRPLRRGNALYDINCLLNAKADQVVHFGLARIEAVDVTSMEAAPHPFEGVKIDRCATAL